MDSPHQLGGSQLPVTHAYDACDTQMYTQSKIISKGSIITFCDFFLFLMYTYERFQYELIRKAWVLSYLFMHQEP